MKIACARKLLRVIYCMLTGGQAYLGGREQLLIIERMNKKAREYQIPKIEDMGARIEKLFMS